MYAGRIKEIRKELGLSVVKLSKKIDTPERTISSYERNERFPSIEFLAKLCNILDVNPYWFLTGKGEMFNSTPQSTKQIEQTKKEILDEVMQMLKDKGVVK